jgi:hypothetical protein
MSALSRDGNRIVDIDARGTVSEKSTRNDVDYAANPRMARHRAVLRCLMQFWIANSLPSSTISAIQSWKKRFPLKALRDPRQWCLCRRREIEAEDDLPC